MHADEFTILCFKVISDYIDNQVVALKLYESLQ